MIGRVFDELYERSMRRVVTLTAGLTPAQLAAVAPATPLWTVRRLLAHLTGAAADAASGRVEGMPGPQWTAAHVAARDGATLDELAAEWAEVAPVIVDALRARRMPVLIVHDLLTHEADLREALDLGRPPADDVNAALDQLARGVTRRMTAPVTLRAGGREWGGGHTAVETSPYELYRGLVSRRSRAQMREWRWTGDPEPHIDALPAFGPCAVDQPIPRA